MAWAYAAYRWPDEAAWLAALAAEGWAEGTPPEVSLLVAGTLYGPPADEATPGAALPGWHVAAAFRDRAAPTAWAAHAIVPAEGMPVLGRGPAPSRTISASAFLGRFTPTETAALWSADARLMAGAMKVMTQGTANLDSAEARGLMALAVARGVLTPARAEAILA